MTTLEIHALQWFPLSCINRDDAGLPKSMILGGERRARWSSQSQKYATRRTFNDRIGNDGALDAESLCTKTRRLPLMTLNVLIERGREVEESARRVATAMFALGVNMNTYNAEAKEKAEGAETSDVQAEAEKDVEDKPFGKYLTGRTQVVLPVATTAPQALATAIEDHWEALGKAGYELDADALKEGKAKKGLSSAKEAKVALADLTKTLDSTRLVDIALFGRFLAEVTGESVDAASSFMHAFTTHPDGAVSEFWSVVDDDHGSQGHAGSANMGTQGLTTGVFYRYASIDLDTLASGPLAGEDALVRKAVAEFMRVFAPLRPRAMVHSTAPYVDPALVVATLTDSPRCLADAFVLPVEPDEGLLTASAQRMAEVWNRTSEAFGNNATGFVLSGHPDTEGIAFRGFESVPTLEALVEGATGVAFDG